MRQLQYVLLALILAPLVVVGVVWIVCQLVIVAISAVVLVGFWNVVRSMRT